MTSAAVSKAEMDVLRKAGSKCAQRVHVEALPQDDFTTPQRVWMDDAGRVFVFSEDGSVVTYPSLDSAQIGNPYTRWEPRGPTMQLSRQAIAELVAQSPLNEAGARMTEFYPSQPPQHEPPPKKGKGVPIWERVIGDMQARDQEGRSKYGLALQTFNGRRALNDLYEELLDAVVYLRQALEESVGISVISYERLDELRRTAMVNIADGVPGDPIPLPSSEVLAILDEINHCRTMFARPITPPYPHFAADDCQQVGACSDWPNCFCAEQRRGKP